MIRFRCAAYSLVTCGLLAAAASYATEGAVDSAPVAKLLVPARRAVDAHRWSVALEKIAQAASLANKTPYDEYVIGYLGCSADIGAGRYPEAVLECGKTLDSAFTPPGRRPELIRDLQSLNFRIKNYAKSTEWGERAVREGYATAESRYLLAEAYYLRQDWGRAESATNALLVSQTEPGKAPPERSLGLLLDVCTKRADEACRNRALEQLVAYYPRSDYWKMLLYPLEQRTAGDDTAALQTYRLMREVGVLESPSDYRNAAELALQGGAACEAQSILESGFSRGVFTDPTIRARNERLLNYLRPRAEKERADLQTAAAAADASANGVRNIAVGIDYFGCGRYPEAAAQLARGLSRGGLPDEASARLLLGIAQFKAGQTADAMKSFETVKGSGPLRLVASYWALHARAA